jgi:hypothetical protein
VDEENIRELCESLEAGDNPDHASDFEIAMRKWVAHEQALRHAREAVSVYDLDPGLLSDIEEAQEDDDHEAWCLAVLRVMKAYSRPSEGPLGRDINDDKGLYG